ncbi:sensor histidine kinase [Brevundimonas balnearis]|uniref:histidine kinase n=1 Tax=Brevundimonas balnearis TaxID=1572858 RepID=A0ABV6R319_9CAUL
MMAEAELAYVAAAGASGLAVAVAAWAWRLSRRAAAVEAELARRTLSQDTRLAEAEAALVAFPDLRLRLDALDRDETGQVPPAALAEIGRRMGVAPGAGVGEVLARLGAVRPRLERLAAEGEPFEARLTGPGGAVALEGRVEGGVAWLRLAPAGPPSTANGAEGEAESSLAGRAAVLAPAPTWTVDPGGLLTWANDAWLEETRLTLAEARGRPGGFDRGVDAMVAEAARSGVRQEGFRWTAGGGRRRAWRIVAEPLPLEAGGGALAWALDATEAEETRDTLRRHVEAHDETLNHLGDAVAIFGPSKRLAFHNTAFQQVFGLDPAWLDERPTHAELLDRLRQRRQLPETSDYAAFKAKELDFYGAAEASPDDSWSLPDGRTLRIVRQPHPLGGLLVIFSDMTDELKLKSRYNAQIQVQRATLDKLNDAVAVFGSDGRLRLHNEAFERFWGVSGDALADAGDFDAVAALCVDVLPDPTLWLGLKARVADPDPESRVPIAGENRTADGRLAAWLTRPLPDGATLVAFSDVTARHELERALMQREAALAESQALKREFVGSVSYELRTPLTTIVGYSELLEHTPDLPERSRQHAGAIRVAAAQLARSIDDVLDMAQIDAGEMELARAPASLAGLIAAAADKARPRIEGRGATLKVQADRGLGDLDIDGRRIGQALDHLLDNAASAVSEGGEVSLSARRDATGVAITVEDTGRGIPYHLQPNVFDRFVRRERGGPGVGLALVKAIAELHGGRAEVRSEPGRGAAFTLHLPARAAVEDAA